MSAPYLFKGNGNSQGTTVNTVCTIIWEEERHGGLTQVGLLKLSPRCIE